MPVITKLKETKLNIEPETEGFSIQKDVYAQGLNFALGMIQNPERLAEQITTECPELGLVAANVREQIQAVIRQAAAEHAKTTGDLPTVSNVVTHVVDSKQGAFAFLPVEVPDKYWKAPGAALASAWVVDFTGPKAKKEAMTHKDIWTVIQLAESEFRIEIPTRLQAGVIYQQAERNAVPAIMAPLKSSAVQLRDAGRSYGSGWAQVSDIACLGVTAERVHVSELLDADGKLIEVRIKPLKK